MFEEEDGGTRVRRRHYGLPGGEQFGGHRAGWAGYLDRMAALIGGPDPGSDPNAYRRPRSVPASDRPGAGS